MNETILVVDDDRTCVALLQRCLEDEHYRVITAFDGITAFEKIKAEKPDVVISDNLMPGMSGYELCEKIHRQTNAIKDIPIIIVSSYKSMKHMFDYSQIHSFISKPLDLSQVLSTISAALIYTRHRNPQEAPKVQSESKSSKILLVGVEESRLRQIASKFQSTGSSVELAFTESDAVSTAQRWRPDIIFGEFWEGSQNFDTLKVFKDLKQHPATRSIPAIVMCKSAVSVEALQVMQGWTIVPYNETSDLFQKLEACL